MNLDLQKLLEIAKKAAIEASLEIIEIYNSEDFSIESKADDSPLTLADKASHAVIVEKLKSTGLPILSEEGKEVQYSERLEWDYFWMIDPLDGTKEFIKRNGEFTVNIALIHKGRPILGVVQVPVSGKLYYALQGHSAMVEVDGQISRLTANSQQLKAKGLRIVTSRSHLDEETKSFLEQFNDPEIVSMGSSLKLLAVAEGTADLYPRYAPTMEWDTAAAHAIVEASGATVKIKNQDSSVTYNKEDLLNPHFLVSCKIVD